MKQAQIEKKKTSHSVALPFKQMQNTEIVLQTSSSQSNIRGVGGGIEQRY